MAKQTRKEIDRLNNQGSQMRLKSNAAQELLDRDRHRHSRTTGSGKGATYRGDEDKIRKNLSKIDWSA